MSRLPSLSFRKVVGALERAGFVFDHASGSHHRYRHPADPSRSAVVPRHSRDIPRGVVRSILRQAKLTEEEFLELL